MAKPHLLTEGPAPRAPAPPQQGPPSSSAPGAAGTLAAVFAGAFLLYFAGTVFRELRTNDEHRYVTVAREFVANGGWWYCRLNGAEYVDKPPVFFWSVALLRKLGASWSAAGMLPSAIGAAAATTLTFDIARRLYGGVAAWAAAVVLAGTMDFHELATRANLDALLTAFTTLAAYGFVRVTLCGADHRGRTRWTVVGMLAVGVGILVKGPSAIAIPGAAVLVALLWDERWAQVPWWRWVLGILLLVAVPDVLGKPPDEEAPLLGFVLPGWIGFTLGVGLFVACTGFWRSRWRALGTWRWTLAALVFVLPVAWACAAAAQAPSGWGYVTQMAVGKGIGHAAGGDKQQHWWFYGKDLPTKLLPWTILLPVAVWSWAVHRTPDRRAGNREIDRFVMAWIVGPLVVLSISRAKRDLYLVPIYPATALLMGRLAMTVASDAALFAAKPVRRSLAIVSWFGVVAGVLCVLLGALRFAGADDVAGRMWEQWGAAGDALPAHVPWVLVVTGSALVAAALVLQRSRTFETAASAVAALVLELAILKALVLTPVHNATESPGRFIERVRARVGDAYVADLGGTSYAANIGLDRTVVPILWRDVGKERSWDAAIELAEQALATTPGRVYFITDRDHLRDLKPPARELPRGTSRLVDDGPLWDDALVLIGRE